MSTQNKRLAMYIGCRDSYSGPVSNSPAYTVLTRPGGAAKIMISTDKLDMFSGNMIERDSSRFPIMLYDIYDPSITIALNKNTKDIVLLFYYFSTSWCRDPGTIELITNAIKIEWLDASDNIIATEYFDVLVVWLSDQISATEITISWPNVLYIYNDSTVLSTASEVCIDAVDSWYGYPALDVYVVLYDCEDPTSNPNCNILAKQYARKEACLPVPASARSVIVIARYAQEIKIGDYIILNRYGLIQPRPRTDLTPTIVS